MAPMRNEGVMEWREARYEEFCVFVRIVAIYPNWKPRLPAWWGTGKSPLR